MKETTKISQRDINNLPDGVHKIDENFYIRVRGKYRNYIFKGTIHGKRREIGLGSSTEMTLAIAKTKALRLRSEIASGQELFVDRMDDKKEQQTKKSFLEVSQEAMEVVRKQKMWRNEKSARQWEQTIRDFAMPVFGKRDIDSLTREDVINVLNPIWLTKTETAARLQRRLDKTFEYAITMGYYTHPNPARWLGNLELFFPLPSKVKDENHHEAATTEELRSIASHFYDSDFISHAACLFGILTACRVQEFLWARWDEIDFNEKVFTVPTDRRKDGKKQPHRVPLSDQTIKMLKRIERSGDFIFLNKKGLPLCQDTPRMILRKNLKRAVTMHGCRSTFRDWAAENGIDPILAEKSLMHSTGNKVESAYQRSDLLELRRPIMQKWADFLLSE